MGWFEWLVSNKSLSFIKEVCDRPVSVWAEHQCLDTEEVTCSSGDAQIMPVYSWKARHPHVFFHGHKKKSALLSDTNKIRRCQETTAGFSTGGSLEVQETFKPQWRQRPFHYSFTPAPCRCPASPRSAVTQWHSQLQFSGRADSASFLKTIFKDDNGVLK